MSPKKKKRRYAKVHRAAALRPPATYTPKYTCFSLFLLRQTPFARPPFPRDTRLSSSHAYTHTPIYSVVLSVFLLISPSRAPTTLSLSPLHSFQKPGMQPARVRSPCGRAADHLSLSLFLGAAVALARATRLFSSPSPHTRIYIYIIKKGDNVGVRAHGRRVARGSSRPGNERERRAIDLPLSASFLPSFVRPFVRFFFSPREKERVGCGLLFSFRRIMTAEGERTKGKVEEDNGPKSRESTDCAAAARMVFVWGVLGRLCLYGYMNFR